MSNFLISNGEIIIIMMPGFAHRCAIRYKKYTYLPEVKVPVLWSRCRCRFEVPGTGHRFFFFIIFFIIFLSFWSPYHISFYHISDPTNFLSYFSLSYFEILKNLYHILYHIFRSYFFSSYMWQTWCFSSY